MSQVRKQAPLVGKISNAVVGFLIGTLGLSLQGAELLHVKGRTSGKTYSVPVNPVMVGGERYLFSPRGETAWVKNIRVAAEGSLQVGRRTEHFQVVEVPDAEKLPIIRAYFDRWYWQVGKLVNVPKDADDAALQGIAGNHPVFRIVTQRGFSQ
jgi:hypothetical protein